jgi:hypothetical protein
LLSDLIEQQIHERKNWRWARPPHLS